MMKTICLNGMCQNMFFLDAALRISIAYFLCAIPFGLLLTKAFGNKKKDIREHGSGNIGATNVMRLHGKTLGITTFLCDAWKGWISCYFLWSANTNINAILLSACIIGHIFPIYLRFRGGKGVATYFALLLFLDIRACLATMIVWGSLLLWKRNAGLSSIVACTLSLCFMSLELYEKSAPMIYIAALGFDVCLIIFKHRSNIQRMLQQRNRL